MSNIQNLRNDPNRWWLFRLRQQVIEGIRDYFRQEKFLEVEVPLLLPTVSTEPQLEVFETRLVDDQGKSRTMYLPSSPEYSMKKLLSAGSGSIYTITKSFRNGEGQSTRHNPEFTILEWYRLGADYLQIADDMRNMMRHIAEYIGMGREEKLDYQGKKYDLNGEWEKLRIAEAFVRYAGIDEETMLDDKKLKEKAAEKGYQLTQNTTWEEIWSQILANEIEPKLGNARPTILYDYPRQLAALSKVSSRDQRYAERAEIYLAGWELANIFTELTDYREYEKRMGEEIAKRAKLGKSQVPLDESLIEAMKEGMPECGGIAVGVDRLVALYANAPDIADIILFPSRDF